MFLSGTAWWPDVSNLLAQAHAPLPVAELDMRACHPAAKATELLARLLRPDSRLSRERADNCVI